MIWQDAALCRGNGDRWLSTTDPRRRGHANVPAINTCDRCPALTDCRAWVLSHAIDPCPFHVVAGMTIRQRNKARRDRRRETAA